MPFASAFRTPPSRSRAPRGGFVLVLVLLLIAGLAATCVALFASVRSEAVTVRAVTNAAKARHGVDAALALAQAVLRSGFEAYPDGATLWEPLVDAQGAALTEGTVFHYRDAPLSGARFCLPLFSGAVPVPLAQKRTAWQLARPELPFAHPDNSVDLNRARYAGDQRGWLGSPSTKRREVRAPWVEIKDEAGRVTGRFAYRIRDESFRLPFHQLGEGPLREGAAPDALPMAGLLAQLGWESAAQEGDAAALRVFRDRWAPLPDLRLPERLALAYPQGLDAPGEAWAYRASLHSGGLNLSRTGAKRVNLNRLFGDPTADARVQIERFIATISTQAPAFGERFYRLSDDMNASQVPPEHQRIYLQKIAANVRDMIDADSQPTILLADGSLAGPSTKAPMPAAGLAGANPVVAIGKEAIPYLQEYAIRVRLTRFTPNRRSANNPEAVYTFYLDHYFEFWNMTGKEITPGDLGPNPYLRVENQPGFDTGDGGTPIPAGRAFSVPLPAGCRFPAGRVTVLTTDPDPPAQLVPTGAHVVVLPLEEERRRYRGFTRKATSDRWFRIDLKARTTQRTDYETAMILGNDHGVIEAFGALPLVRGDSKGNLALSLHNDDEGDPLKDTIANPERYFIRGGSLRGNARTPGVPIYGDPRTNNEQLTLRTYVENASDYEQTRYYTSELGNAAVPAESSLGAQNKNFVDPSLWPEPFEWSPSGVDVVMTVPDAPLKSIGELGHLFDPARELGPSREIAYSRGGGRTLAVGQRDPLWDGDPDAPSRQWAAWRLADLFSTGDEVALPGQINPNGVLRDGGAAFAAAFHGDVRYPPSAVEAMLAQLRGRLESHGFPLEERGELSEWLGPLAAGLPDPEAAFRELSELVTTRGNVFTIHALAQTIAQTPAGERRVRATAQLQVSVALEPEWTPPLEDDFDPTQPEAVQARMRPPDRYRLKVLRAAP